MKIISPDQWTPVGVASLESAAQKAVRSRENTLVIAGPGAGKTELLAQRASFLLETATCPAPQRILAISFKKDAAKNLKERVAIRCGERSSRFDSLTLDAFAKNLVDRFRLALPEEWRPTADYEVVTRSLNVREQRRWIRTKGAPPGYTPLNLARYSDDRVRRTFDSVCHGQRLPYDDPDVHPYAAHLVHCWWREQLGNGSGQSSRLNFPMISRLAAFLLRSNPKLTLAIRSTYTFTFLDEFQDTTAAQYDLIRAAFHGSNTVLTAVGDSKQRIMVWAGAMTDIFEVFQEDFDAQVEELVSNYRSAPELVRMQHTIAETLEAGTSSVEARKLDIEGGCEIFEFSNPTQEACYLAEMIDTGLRLDGMMPRDFCILVRQSTGDMIVTLKEVLAGKDIKLRDESQLQDLLTEPVVQFLLAILRLATRTRDAEAWTYLTEELALLLGLDQADEFTKIENGATKLLLHARGAIAAGCSAAELPAELITMLGDAPFRAVYRQYSNGSYLGEVIDKLSIELKQTADSTRTAQQVVDDLIGDDVVPAMTIHKSKGLEFRTVIFLGLEDSQWWNFAKQPDEDKRGFFVAFSRAIECVYFTYCDSRKERWGWKQQQRAQIEDLYITLRRAGVSSIDCR